MPSDFVCQQCNRVVLPPFEDEYCPHCDFSLVEGTPRPPPRGPLWRRALVRSTDDQWLAGFGLVLGALIIVIGLATGATRDVPFLHVAVIVATGLGFGMAGTANLLLASVLKAHRLTGVTHIAALAAKIVLGTALFLTALFLAAVVTLVAQD